MTTPSHIPHPTSDRPTSPSHIQHPTSDRPSPASHIQHPAPSGSVPPSHIPHPSSDGSSTPSHISRLTSVIIFTLQLLIKFRKAGLITLSIMFLANCYFMLFDQQVYIAFLEHYGSPDGHISDINSVFFKVEISIILTSIFWYLIDQPSIDLMLEHAQQDQSKLSWKQRQRPYMIACSIWLLISYLPYLFMDDQTIINSIKEDGFFQNCGASFLFIASMLFFYLFFRSKQDQPVSVAKKRGNIWFLLLGLLFFFGAGEEISWGQRIFNFKTPAFMSSNIQSEFSIHNLPLFDGRSEKPYFDEHGVLVEKTKTGFIATHMTASSLLSDFCIFSLIVIPILCLISSRTRGIVRALRLPVAPLYSGIFFLIETIMYQITNAHYHAMSTQAKLEMAWGTARIDHSLAWSAAELHETFISFLFMLVAIWLIHSHSPNHSA